MSCGTIIIRADANATIGTGHVMRCLALAQAWQDAGGQCCFAVSGIAPALANRLQTEGMEIEQIRAKPGSEQDCDQLCDFAHSREAEWVVLDGYEFDGDYQKRVKQAGSRLLFVDDYGRAGSYHADVVLNHNLLASEDMYREREKRTRLLLGTRYALLRREFTGWRDWTREIPEVGRKVLVTMGGSDPDRLTGRLINALKSMPQMEVTVVIGGCNTEFGSIQGAEGCFEGNVRWVRARTDMAKLISEADIVIAIAGGTLWESLCMSCPAMTYSRDAFQKRVVSKLAEAGAVCDMGYAGEFDSAGVEAVLSDLASSPSWRSEMANAGRRLVDGKGAERVCGILLEQEPRTDAKADLIPIEAADRDCFLEMSKMLFRELNPQFFPDPDWQQHYFENILANQNLHLRWIITEGQRVGFILSGLERHRFLPRWTGMVYELYILPEFRRRGIARCCAAQVIQELESRQPSKIQLEVATGNSAAVTFWNTLGFEAVSTRFVLKKKKSE